MKKKYAILDVDGTILDSMYVWDQAGNKYLESLKIVPEEDLTSVLSKLSMEEGADYLKTAYGITKKKEEIIDGICNIVEEDYKHHVQLKKGVKNLLLFLYRSKIPMSVATASERQLVIHAFKRLHILDYFETIMTCTGLGLSKDSPEFFIKAAKECEVNPKDVLVIEDAVHAMDAAKKAGCTVIGVYDEYTKEPREEVLKHCDVFVDCLDDLIYQLKKMRQKVGY